METDPEKTLRSVSIQPTCVHCGVLPQGAIFRVGDYVFCANCLGSHLMSAGLSQVAMERTEHFPTSTGSHVACIWCGVLRPSGPSACPSCGRQPGYDDPAP
jgi:hypothetical protein